VVFTLGNNGDDLRYSTVDIAYTVTVTGAEGATVTPSEGTLKSGEISQDTITLSGLKDGETYTVTVVGAGGYQESLTGTFQVQNTTPKVYQWVDASNSQYILLTVWTQGYAGSVTITFPTDLAPDNTDPVMETVLSENGGFTDSTSFKDISGYTSHAYRFFGSTEGGFTVTYGDGNTADTKTPN
jgi:hypothetical protein